MAVDYSLLRNISAREMVRALNRDGFTLDHQRGSHQHYYHSDGRHVTVSFHNPGDTFSIKTLKAMVQQARWTEDDLRRLDLIR
jgi:predicted RNA binding protein YcfA (HicA-like mRNA interferase family)